MAEFKAVNRDLLDYRFPYMLTSERLRAINTGNQAEAATLEAARRKAVKAAQAFDTPLFGQVAEAEGRLGGLLASTCRARRPMRIWSHRRPAALSPRSLPSGWF